MIQVVITKYQCTRCLNKRTGKPHEWIPRVTHLPIRCPNCRSPYWNSPRVRKIKPKLVYKKVGRAKPR